MSSLPRIYIRNFKYIHKNNFWSNSSPSTFFSGSKYAAFFLKYEWVFLRTFRAAQVIIISAGIFSAGYSFGLMSFASDPQAMDQMLLHQAITSNSTIKDAKNSYHDKRTAEYKRVAQIGNRVINAARSYCEAKIHTIEHKLAEKTRVSISKRDVNSLNEELEYWKLAYHRVDGPWSYIIIKDKSIANAFVADTCPRRIFVLEGFFNILSPTDEELGLVLSHEIAHVVLGHSMDKAISRAVINLLQLVLLSFVDPSGLLSSLFEGAAFLSNFAVSRGYDRSCESEADLIGLQIATIACFDVSRGVEFFSKLATFEGHRVTRWHHTHPSSDDRHNVMLQHISSLKMQEALEYCQKLKKDFLYSLSIIKEDAEVAHVLRSLGLTPEVVVVPSPIDKKTDAQKPSKVGGNEKILSK